MTRLACGSGAVEATMFGWEWEECPSIQLDYAISLDRPRFQLLGMLHEINRATKQKKKKGAVESCRRSSVFDRGRMCRRVWMM